MCVFVCVCVYINGVNPRVLAARPGRRRPRHKPTHIG